MGPVFTAGKKLLNRPHVGKQEDPWMGQAKNCLALPQDCRLMTANTKPPRFSPKGKVSEERPKKR